MSRPSFLPGYMRKCARTSRDHFFPSVNPMRGTATGTVRLITHSLIWFSRGLEKWKINVLVAIGKNIFQDSRSIAAVRLTDIRKVWTRFRVEFVALIWAINGIKTVYFFNFARCTKFWILVADQSALMAYYARFLCVNDFLTPFPTFNELTKIIF